MSLAAGRFQFVDFIDENDTALGACQIAELAAEYKAGARSLRGIFEEMMTDVLYAIPDNPAITAVHIHSLFEPAVLSTANP